MSETWQAPGGGRWEQDAEHVPGPITGYLFATVTSLFDGMAESMRSYGIPLAGFDARLVAGRLYGRARPIGAPDPDRFGGGPNGAPPKVVLRLLFALHPELRRRTRAAAETLKTRRWRADAAHWRDELEPALRARNLEYGRVDVSTLDDAALAAHIDQLHEAFAEGFRQHGRQFGLVAVPVGMWLRGALDWTDAPPEHIIGALRGTSPASAASVAAIDRIADATRAANGAADILERRRNDPGARLTELASSSPALAAAIRDYLAEDGYRPVTGVDIVDKTAREMPGILLDAVASRLAPADRRAAPAGPTVEAAAELRDRVPAERRAEYDSLLAEARAMFGIRDDDVWVTTQWPEGMLRHALLEAGRRLQARGAITQVEHVLDTLPGETPALLRGATSPLAAQLAARAAERHSYDDKTPPLAFGEDPGPLDLGAMPAPIAELMAAMMVFGEIDARAAAVPETRVGASAETRPASAETGNRAVHGLGVSAGQYRGRARVVLSPTDFDRIEQGDVLVARTTSPAYNVLLPLIGAIVTDRGGLLSHAALVAREFGIPGVVATRNGTTRITDGATITVDAERGLVLVQ